MSAPTVDYVYAARYLDAVDGDTYEMLIDWGGDSYSKLAIRLKGYGAKELHEPGGPEAMREARRILSSAKYIVVKLYRTRTTDQNNPKYQRTFARFLADIWVDDVPMFEAMGGFVHPGNTEGIVPNRKISQWEIGGYRPENGPKIEA